MDDLFPSTSPPEPPLRSMPLAARLRPSRLEEVAGQQHLLAPGKPLRRLIESDRFSSILLFGPPGVGKTTLAEIIAQTTQSDFERINAVESSVPELRKILAAASARHHKSGKRTVLFVDEIHRFNKSQQDVLLPDMESGAIRLIGATTHNPSFYVNSPLLSRSQVFELQPLPAEALQELLDRALNHRERGFGEWSIDLQPEARAHLLAHSEGDARRLLNSLEMAVLTTSPEPDGQIKIDRQTLEDCLARKTPTYDKGEDEHYNTISAFIKSVRGSDPDAAIYWLAKMLVAGEDPRFIARRLVILASEDVGMADPRGLMVAMAAQEAFEFIGMPEGRIPLAHATIYLATCPKSNAAYMALNRAIEAVEKEATIPVPSHLRDTSYPGAKKLQMGAPYAYSHDYPEGISGQDYGVTPGTFYQPVGRGYEKEIKARLDHWITLRNK